MLDTDHFLTDLNFRFREQIVDLTAYHGFDQIRIGDPVYIICSDVLGISENGDP